MDRLRALEIFKAVAERGSFVRAADALELSTPQVTRAVQDLERLLGARLLQRSTRRVSLTGEGRHVLERARTLLGSFAELAAFGDASTSQIAGDVRLTAPASFGAERVVPAVAEFMAHHPDVRVELVLTDAPLDLVEHGIDLAVRVARELPPSLIARRIGSARVGVFGSPAYLQRKGTPRHPEELGQHDCLVYGTPGRRQPWLFSHPVTDQRIEPDIRDRLRADNGEALLAAAVHGAGLAMLPYFVAKQALAAGLLHEVLSHWSSPPLGIHLAYSSRSHQPLRVRRLIDHLVQRLAGAPRSEEWLPGARDAQRVEMAA